MRLVGGGLSTLVGGGLSTLVGGGLSTLVGTGLSTLVGDGRLKPLPHPLSNEEYTFRSCTM